MDVVYVIITILVAVVFANFLGQRFSNVPKAFWQIALGLVISLLPGMNNFELLPEYFMMLIVAPLLFWEAVNTSAAAIVKNWRAIVGFSVVAAGITILISSGIGWLVLGWSFPILIALSAIITPTDATALDSISARYLMPDGVKRALSFESLFNDATGLVALAIVTVGLNTGKFSIFYSIREFLYVALGGLLVGAVSGFLLIQVRQVLLRNQLDDTGAQTLISLLTPFAIYLIAEHFGMSGILAAISTGLTLNIERNRLQFLSSQLTNLNNQLWRVITETLNGVVFVLLGVSFPKVIGKFDFSGFSSFSRILFAGIIIYAVIIAVRFAIMFYGRDDKDYAVFFTEEKNEHRSINESLVFAFGGIRGTVTMSLAFSLPVTLSDGTTFPHRDQIISIVAVVIILSLLVPLVAYRYLLEPASDNYSEKEIRNLRKELVTYANQFVEGANYSDAIKKSVLQRIQDQLGYGPEQLDREEWRTALQTIDAIRSDEIGKEIEKNKVSENGIKLFQFIELARSGKYGPQSQLNGMYFFRIKQHADRVYWEMMGQRQPKFFGRETTHEQQQIVIQAADELIQVSNSAVERYINKLKKQGQDKRLIIALQDSALAERRTRNIDEESLQLIDELFLSAIQEELSFLQQKRLDKTVNAVLIKDLYSEVVAAQSITFSNSELG